MGAQKGKAQGRTHEKADCFCMGDIWNRAHAGSFADVLEGGRFGKRRENKFAGTRSVTP
jgi:hypothetical protein